MAPQITASVEDYINSTNQDSFAITGVCEASSENVVIKASDSSANAISDVVVTCPADGNWSSQLGMGAP